MYIACMVVIIIIIIIHSIVFDEVETHHIRNKIVLSVIRYTYVYFFRLSLHFHTLCNIMYNMCIESD